MSKVCINIAWPYANGPIHLGHVAGSLLPPDIFRRYNLLLGNEVLMIGGSDQHGTPITISAEKCGMSPEEYADKYHEINKKAIEDLNIHYFFNKTHCPVHFEVVQDVFKKLMDNGYIYVRETNQYFCPKCDRFLPDRYVEGICPKCGAEKTRSDQCDSCGTTFEPGDLKEPYCTLCGSTPEIRPTKHFFLKLSAFTDRLIDYVKDKDYWRSNVKSFTQNWLQGEGLTDRAITRDMSWGVPIPVEGWDDKVIYVWFDAVIGYLSASVEYSRQIGKPDYWKEFWQNPDCKHYYFIGKDNIPFHSIIWPAILMGLGDMQLPYDIPANEYLMIGGGKLSKSRGGAIDIPSVLEKYDADIVRYYLSAVMPDTHDSEFTWEDFQTKVNTELVANLGNFFHRSLDFSKKNFGTIPAGDMDPEVTKAIEEAVNEFSECLSHCDFKKALKAVMNLSSFGNKYFNDAAPWKLVKEDKDACGKVIHNVLRIVQALSVISWPYVPAAAEKVWGFLGNAGTIQDAGLSAATKDVVTGQQLNDSVPVFKKLDIPELKQNNQKQENKQEQPATFTGPFADFRRLDIRVGTIVSVEDHPEAEKLYVLKVNLGEEEPRQLVTNIKSLFSKDYMMGRRLLVISNLKKAKFRGVESFGMLMAADDEGVGGDHLALLKPNTDVPDGTKLNCGLENSSSRIELKQFEAVKIKVSSIKDGKFMGKDIKLPANAPRMVTAVIDGDNVIPLGDGKECVITVDDDSQILDGADVR
jgi:methionyl-tRNA synthetase